MRFLVVVMLAPVAGRLARCPDAPWAFCSEGGDVASAEVEASGPQEALLWAPAGGGGANASAAAAEVLAEAGEGGNATSHFVALRCAESRGYLVTAKHPVLGTTVSIEGGGPLGGAASLLPPREAVWHLTQSASGLTVLEGLDGGLLTMNGKSGRPPWMLFVVPPASAMDATSTASDMTFRIELEAASLRDDREKRATGRLYSTAARAYVNCVAGKHLRGHGSKPNNERAAGREPTTLLELWTLTPAQAARAESAADGERGGGNGGRVQAAAPPARKTGRAGVGGFFKTARRNKRPAAKGKYASDEAEAASPAPRDCAKACYGDVTDGAGGYPPVAFPAPAADFLCPSAFRDAADWVFAWPWSHFAERTWVASSTSAAKCLGDVPVVYAHANRLERAVAWAAKDLRRPFILVSGQSDYAASKYRKILRSDYLVRWYAQNSDLTHPKVRAIPIGLNCFEQGPEMQTAVLQLHRAAHRAGRRAESFGERPKQLWVNFGNTHARRKVAWEHFCGDAKARKAPKPWATCVVKKEKNAVRGNPHLVKYYEQVASHRYVAAPRGNGLDTHRFWEALYLGCVPVVERGPLDALYERVGALIVKSWKDITPALLDAAYASRAAAIANATAVLTASHWRRAIERDRAAQASRSKADRSRCWGPSAGK